MKINIPNTQCGPKHAKMSQTAFDEIHTIISGGTPTTENALEEKKT